MRAGISREEATLDAEVLARHVLDCDRATFLTRARDPLPSAFDRLFEALVATTRRARTGRLHRRSPGILGPRVRGHSGRPHSQTRNRADHRRSAGRDAGARCRPTHHRCRNRKWVPRGRPGNRVRGGRRDCHRFVASAALTIAERNAARYNARGSRLVPPRRSPRYRRRLCRPHRLESALSSPEDDAARLQPEVAQYEPSSALYAGPDGLDVIRRLLNAAPATGLRTDGRLIIEFGFEQEPGVRDAAAQRGLDRRTHSSGSAEHSTHRGAEEVTWPIVFSAN